MRKTRNSETDPRIRNSNRSRANKTKRQQRIERKKLDKLKRGVKNEC